MDSVDALDDDIYETGDGGREAVLATDDGDGCDDDSAASSSWCPPEDDADEDLASSASANGTDDADSYGGGDADDDCDDDAVARGGDGGDADCESGDSLAALPERDDACGEGSGRVMDSSTGDDGDDPRAGSTEQPAGADPGRDPSAPLVPLDLAAAAAATSSVTAPGVSPFAGVPGLGGDTEAILGSVSGQLADAGLIAHAPLGSTDPALTAAMERADISGRAAASLAGAVHEETVRNDVREHEQVASTIEESRREELNAWIAEHNPNSTLGTF